LQKAVSNAVRCDDNVEVQIPTNTRGKSVSGFIIRSLSEVSDGVLSNVPRALLIFHYVGHGRDEGGSGLMLGPSARRQFPFREVNKILTNGLMGDHGMDNVDIAYILDCCASAAAVRGVDTKTVELLAATTTTTTMRHSGISFTQAVSSALQNLAREKAPMALQSIYQKLLFRSMTPVNVLLSGHSTIVLPKKNAPQTGTNSSNENYGALVCVQIPNDYTDEKVGQFCRWINMLPAELNVTVKDIYRTNSCALFIMMPLSLATVIAGPCVNIVLVNACSVVVAPDHDEDKENKDPTARRFNVNRSLPQQLITNLGLVFRDHNK
jgi:hypothetical protein